MPNSIWALATHPLALMAAQVCHSAALMGFTSSDSFVRFAVFPVQIWIAWLAVQGSRVSHHGSYHAVLAASGVMVYPWDYIDRVLLQGWAFEPKGPTRTFGSDSQAHGIVTGKESKDASRLAGSFWARLTFGLNAAISRRHINTPFEVKNCSRFSSKDKSYVPSRSRFLLGALGSLVACYAFLDINDANAQSGQDASIFAPDKVPLFTRLGNIDVEEVALRFILSVMIWTTSYFMLRMAYEGASILCVGLKLTKVESWRPMFGSIWELYTVRRFWG